MPGRSASLQPPTGPQHLTRQTLRRAIGAGIHREAAQSHQPRHHCRLHARTAHTAVDGDGKSAASRLWEKIETSNLTHAEILRELEGTNKDVLSSALGQRGERKSGSKAELVSRLAPLLTRETEERQQGQPGTARPSEPAAEVDIISGASSKPTAKESSNLMKVSQQAAREATPSLKESDLDKAGGRDQPASVLDAESEDFDPEADSYQDDPEAGYDIADEGEGDSFDEELSSPDNAAGASAADNSLEGSDSSIDDSDDESQPATADGKRVDLIGHHEDVNALLKGEIQEQLMARGLSDQGKKRALATRLKEALQREALGAASRSNPTGAESYQVPGGVSSQDSSSVDEASEELEELVVAQDLMWYWRIDDTEAGPEFRPSRLDLLGLHADHFSSPRGD